MFGEVPPTLDACLSGQGARVLRPPSLAPPSADAVLAITADVERLAEARSALGDLPMLALVASESTAPNAARAGADFVLLRTSAPALVEAVLVAVRRSRRRRVPPLRSDAPGEGADLRATLARAAHDLNNPLQYVLTAVEELEAAAVAGHPDLGPVVADLRHGVERIREVTRAMVVPLRRAAPPGRRKPASRPPDALARTASEAATAEVASRARAPRGRVLVIDDEELLLRTYERCLRGAEVVTARGGRAALDVLGRDADFDVVVCDLTMPDVDGMLVHAWVDEHAPELQPRILFCSGGALTPRVRDFVDHVTNTVLDKPVTASELRAAVGELIRVRRTGSDSER